MAEKDARLLEQIRELAEANPRFGYRRILVLLEWKGTSMSEDRMYRLWRLANLQVRRKRRRRRASHPSPRPQAATRRNHVWACDFIFDHCANGQKLKCLTLVDERTRECLAIEVGAMMPSSRVIAVLDRLIREHGAPEFLRSDNGPEFLSKALRRWLAKRNVKPAFIEPGKPW